jgi:hypothetical protein
MRHSAIDSKLIGSISPYMSSTSIYSNSEANESSDLVYENDSHLADPYNIKNLIMQRKLYDKRLLNLQTQLKELKLRRNATVNSSPSSCIPARLVMPDIRNHVEDYVNESARLDKESNESKLIVDCWYEKQKLDIEKQYEAEKLSCENEFSQRLKELKVQLLVEEQEMKKQLDIERNILDLNIDPSDHDSLPITRKLRRRNTHVINSTSFNVNSNTPLKHHLSFHHHIHFHSMNTSNVNSENNNNTSSSNE